MAIASLAWVCTRDPKINFLPRDGQAEWILFPRAMDSTAHPVANLDTVFRREFTLDDQPRAARLDFRAAKRAELNINGTPVEIAAARNWKDVASVDVVAFLRPGKNSIEAKVFNDNAPPALWLTLTADQFTLRSDGTWEASCTGSAWRPAALAATPRLPGPGNPMAGGEGTFAALRSVWLMWLMFAGIAVALCIAGHRWLGRVLKLVAGGGLSRRQMTCLAFGDRRFVGAPLLEQCRPDAISPRLRFTRAPRLHQIRPGTSRAPVADRGLRDVSAPSLLRFVSGRAFIVRPFG